jgi:hypothetical protein
MSRDAGARLSPTDALPRTAGWVACRIRSGSGMAGTDWRRLAGEP